MGSLSGSTGIGVKDKGSFKKRFNNSYNSVVQHSVSDTSLVDVPQFWVMDAKRSILTVTVRLSYQVVMQAKKVFSQVVSKNLHVRFVLLAQLKLPPGDQKVFFGNNTVI